MSVSNQLQLLNKMFPCSVGTYKAYEVNWRNMILCHWLKDSTSFYGSRTLVHLGTIKVYIDVYCFSEFNRSSIKAAYACTSVIKMCVAVVLK